MLRNSQIRRVSFLIVNVKWIMCVPNAKPTAEGYLPKHLLIYVSRWRRVDQNVDSRDGNAYVNLKCLGQEYKVCNIFASTRCEIPSVTLIDWDTLEHNLLRRCSNFSYSWIRTLRSLLLKIRVLVWYFKDLFKFAT